GHIEIGTETGVVIRGIIHWGRKRPAYSIFQRQARTHFPTVPHVEFQVAPTSLRFTVARVLAVAPVDAADQIVAVFIAGGAVLREYGLKGGLDGAIQRRCISTSREINPVR